MKIVIAGTGAIVLALVDELHKIAAHILLLNNDQPLLEKLPDDVAVESCNLTDTAALINACKGFDVLIHAAPLTPAKPTDQSLAIMENLIAAAEASAIPLLYIDNMAAYGDNMGIPMSEATPERPLYPAEMAQARLGKLVMNADQSGRIRACIARCSDLYGPRITEGPLGETVFASIVNGKPAVMLGRLDMPHSFLFVRDMARSVLKLLDNDKAWGQLWHIPSPQPITQQQILDILRNMVTRPISVRTITSNMMGLKKLFQADLKEVEGQLYRFEKPYVVNHSRFSTNFGERVTAHEQALFDTLEWYKRRAGIERRYGF